MKYNAENIYVNLDVDNPACLDNPYVQMAMVDHKPKTDEEVAEFAANNEVIGTMNDVFPGKIDCVSVAKAYAEHNPSEIYDLAIACLQEIGEKDLAFALSHLKRIAVKED